MKVYIRNSDGEYRMSKCDKDAFGPNISEISESFWLSYLEHLKNCAHWRHTLGILCGDYRDNDGTSGQDRESYSDNQDRDSYTVD